MISSLFLVRWLTLCHHRNLNRLTVHPGYVIVRQFVDRGVLVVSDRVQFKQPYFSIGCFLCSSHAIAATFAALLTKVESCHVRLFSPVFIMTRTTHLFIGVSSIHGVGCPGRCGL